MCNFWNVEWFVGFVGSYNGNIIGVSGEGGDEGIMEILYFILLLLVNRVVYNGNIIGVSGEGGDEGIMEILYFIFIFYFLRKIIEKNEKLVLVW